MDAMQPKQRSQLRIFLGKKYYRLKRSIHWYVGQEHYAKARASEGLKYDVFTHQTVLLRQLKDVDMWLQHNKVKNLTIAAKRLSGILIKPGETFSYWKLIGNTTKRKGYVDGMILHYGKVTTGTGGGLCQLSNLIYWMVLHSPLTVTERYRHSYDVFPDSKRSQPFGSGATCSYNYLDLQFNNDTNQTFQLNVEVTDTHLVGHILSDVPTLHRYKIYEKNHRLSQAHWGSYLRHNQLYRKVYNASGEELRDEYVTENHAIMMYDPFLQSPETSDFC
ncbi:hypothetical protein HMI01_28340 [Halolactibacillus miurensis]|uniref:Vancomycin resistance protein VanW n=1 Tax=Halolactibacillus miurensis TaxID=306541 RepID=A0A1I6V637_9BACI|nr:hypothetical protein HMI01_28340 [Halolactibacillus miurensis]SFT09183.1 vancomycin resistance protein VanW [Halolactibacillus miurensis]